jgi:hypothetical protein
MSKDLGIRVFKFEYHIFYVLAFSFLFFNFLKNVMNLLIS